MTKVKSAGLYD